MIFVGSKEKGYFAEEISEKIDSAFFYVDSHAHISAQVNMILEHGKQDYTIFDIEQYIDEADVIADYVTKICNANNSKPIILASGYLRESAIIVELAKNEVKYFILASVLSDMKDQLLKCINGFYDANGIEFVDEMKKDAEAAEERQKIDYKTIAVAGASKRVGTTTVAVQLIRFIQLMGKKACYIQMNSSDYIKSMKEWFVIEEDEEIGNVIYENVDHYYKLNNIREIMSKGYDYYIYDYGAYFDTDFNKVSFLERDVQIFVAGTDPSEMSDTVKIIRSSFYDSANYIYNFTPDADQKEVLDMMEEKSAHTYFMTYIPDKYVYVPNNCYSSILAIMNNSVPEERERKGFFKRWKK